MAKKANLTQGHEYSTPILKSRIFEKDCKNKEDPQHLDRFMERALLNLTSALCDFRAGLQEMQKKYTTESDEYKTMAGLIDDFYDGIIENALSAHLIEQVTEERNDGN